MYLVDTNVISEARRGTAAAVDWMRSVDADSIRLSVITLGEIARGIALKRRSDPRAASHLAEWLLGLRQDHGDRILAVTGQVAVEWGRIAAIRPRGDADVSSKHASINPLNAKAEAAIVSASPNSVRA